MKKTSKIWLLIATLLLLIGGGILTVSLANNNWDFLKQSIITNTHLLEGEFNNIIIESHTADIEIKSSSDNVNKVVCKETEKEFRKGLLADFLKISKTKISKVQHLKLALKQIKVIEMLYGYLTKGRG